MPAFAQNFSSYAQSSFEVLCDIADVTKNPSIQDREGWDYLVEFARERVPGLPHDRQPGNATVRVQVKSKTDGKPTTSVKLSNALRFANEPDPCFIALWWRNSDHSEERIYARHFDKPLMEAALRRAREAQRDGKMDLHRLRLSIAFDEADDHTDDLLPWIRSIGDTDQHDYANRKRQLTRELGFDEGHFGGTLKLPFDDVQKLIDAAVGLPTSPADVEITFGDKRFDIVSPLFAGKPTIFNLNAIPQLGQLTFQNAAGQTRKIHLRFNDPIELEAGMLATDNTSARAIVAQRFGALATRIGKGALILNGGDYLSLMRKEGPLIEVL